MLGLFKELEKDYQEQLNGKSIDEIYKKLNATEHKYGIELKHFPTELFDKMILLSSRINDLETYDDRTDSEGVFLGKDGHEKLKKVIFHLSQIENIIG